VFGLAVKPVCASDEAFKSVEDAPDIRARRLSLGPGIRLTLFPVVGYSRAKMQDSCLICFSSVFWVFEAARGFSKIAGFFLAVGRGDED
jgi:hypothetical protein